MRRLSLSLDRLKPHYDVIVIGSGYGGGIAASRMARAGRSVCLLERGEERQPGEYPGTLADAAKQMQVDTPLAHSGSPTGMFDFHVNKDINVLVGCGLGGTSLINANVSIKPEPRVFDDPRWPAEIRTDLETILEDGYRHATDMLRPTPYPDDWPALAKTEAHRKSAAVMDQKFYKTAINVTFADGVNHVGVDQRKCTLCGDCVTGCNHWAKNTTLMNYLPDAVNHGAEIFTGTRVREVRPQGHEWMVLFEPIGAARGRFDAPLLGVTAGIVILSAGTLGSTEILLRSRANGLPASNTIGERFSGNGDVVGFAYNTADAVSGIGWGNRDAGLPVGPCITSVIDEREQPDLECGLIIEEGSLPGAMAPYLGGVFAAAAPIASASGSAPAFRDMPRQMAAGAASVVAGGHVGAVEHTQTFLIMSHDGSDGRLHLEDDRLRVDWPAIGTRDGFTRCSDRLHAATEALGGIYVKNPTWTAALGHNLITVHPLGGCAMAERAEHGVTNHKGQVFSGPSGDAVHAGLYVCDGAVVPRSLGVNPLLTISALAERACHFIARDHGWTIDYTLPSASGQTAGDRAMGLQFTEKMVGGFSTAITDSYKSAGARGAADRSSLEFVLTVATDDLERTLAEPEHEARMYGTVIAAELSPHPMTVSNGIFNLFCEYAGAMQTRNMRYRMQLTTREGRLYYFEGFKKIKSGSLFDVWPQTSTLYVTVHDGADASAPVHGRGILHIRPADFARQMTTMKITNTSNPVARGKALAAFGSLFAGVLWHTYGGVAANVLSSGVEAMARESRTLDAPEPELHFFRTDDNAELRLVRFNGGSKGPLIAAPGFGNSTNVFSFDGVDETFAEFFSKRGYDVWLFDYRASPDLQVSRTQFTLDTIATHDWPSAVAYVREQTGARDVQVLAHCMGSMTCFMALLSGLQGVRQFISSQLTTHPVVELRGKLKAGFHLNQLLEGVGARGVTTSAGGTLTGEAIDRALALYAMPADWAGAGPVCRRIFALYGPCFKPANLNRPTQDALAGMFGFGNLTAFNQISAILRHGHIVDAKGRDVYLPNVGKLTLPIVLVHGAENVFFYPRGSEKTYAWLREHNGTELYRRIVIPGYAHLDLFIGKNAARDVFPQLLHQLEPLSEAHID